MSDKTQTAVMEVAGVHWASSKSITEASLSRRPGVVRVEANPVSQSANVTFDPEVTSIADLTEWIRDCGYPGTTRRLLAAIRGRPPRGRRRRATAVTPPMTGMPAWGRLASVSPSPATRRRSWVTEAVMACRWGR